MTDRQQGFLFIIATAIIFSWVEIVMKFVATGFNPLQLTFSRFFVGGLVLMPLALRAMKKRGVRPDAKAYGRFALLGFVGMFVSMTLYQVALFYTNASVVAVLFSSNTLFTAFFAFLLLHEAIYARNVIALALDVIGMLIIIQPWNTQLSAIGIALTLISAIIFSLYGVLGKESCAKYGGVAVSSMGFLFGSVEMMIAAAISHIPPVAEFLNSVGLHQFARIPFFAGYTPDNVLLMILVYIVFTGIGFTCYFMAMEKTSAQTTSLVFFFKPAIAPVFAMFALHEVIPPNMIAGIVCILLGSFTSLFGGKIAQKMKR